MITSFEQIYEILRSKTRKRLIAAWAVDDHTITAAYKAVELGIVDATLVGDVNMIKKVCEAEKIDPSVFTIINNENELASIAQAVLMVREGQGDILMKGLCSTDKYMRGILNKEKGLLPPKAVLSHVCVLDNPNYHKLIVLGDMAVIPLPDLNQKIAIVKYLVNTAKALQIEKPKVALLAATEQMLPAMQACVDAAIISKMIDRGQIPGCLGDGPLALDVAISKEAVQIKKLVSPVAGDADCLLFPNIESAPGCQAGCHRSRSHGSLRALQPCRQYRDQVELNSTRSTHSKIEPRNHGIYTGNKPRFHFYQDSSFRGGKRSIYKDTQTFVRGDLAVREGHRPARVPREDHPCGTGREWCQAFRHRGHRRPRRSAPSHILRCI